MRSRRTPTYCLHKASGQAVVRIDGRDIYLGLHGSTESKRRFGEAITTWLGGGDVAPRARPLSVAELIERFDAWAAQEYPTGQNGGQRSSFKYALRPVAELYLERDAESFGPMELRAVRQRMIDAGLARTLINQRVRFIRQVWRWAVGRALIPPAVLDGLRAVEPLRVGARGVRETEPVRPVPLEVVEATIAHASPPVAAMIRLQLFTGMRPGEVVQLRPVDVDTTGPTWWFKPARHKNRHRGSSRTIPLIASAQDVLRPFLLRPVDAPCFSPAEAVEWWRDEANALRTTPLNEGNRRGLRLVEAPTVQPGHAFTTQSFGHAIRHACRRAFPGPPDIPAGELRSWRRDHPDEAKAWDAEHAWAPNRIRHLVATTIRRRLGLDAARVVLGHSSSAITAAVYAEISSEHAAELLTRFEREALAG